MRIGSLATLGLSIHRDRRRRRWQTPPLNNAALLKRFAEDLQIRGRSPRTVESYSARLRHFATYLEGRPVHDVTPEQIRGFQLHLTERKLSWSAFNQSVCALRFLYSVTLAGYLVDAKRLRARFREYFLGGLTRLYKSERLRLGGDFQWLKEPAAWDEMMEQLRCVDWTVFIEPPPSEQARPEHVIKYLARYMTGGPISDHRLISHENNIVTFWARRGDRLGGGGRASSAPYPLTGTEFVRRWSPHILPRGYVKTRRFGGYSSRQRAEYLRQCDALLGQHSDPEPSEPEEAESPLAVDQGCRCPGCGCEMKLLCCKARPSWSEVMSGAARPRWYRDD